MSRSSAAVALLVLSAAAWPPTGCRREPPRPQPSPRPRTAAPGSGYNLLLITIDTLRADHLGLYGYRRATSPHIDALGRRSMVFDQAYTFWPKTRGSFAMLFTGRTPSQNGYSKKHPLILGFNPTLATVLKAGGYATAATVDNPNVAASTATRRASTATARPGWRRPWPRRWTARGPSRPTACAT